jgi:multiple sugar transport system substrate-binding protein
MRRLLASIAAASAVAYATFATPALAQTEITLWSHWAPRRSSATMSRTRSSASRRRNPGVKVKASWYEKTALYAALKTALRAGQAPDIFYAEPDQVEYMENGFLLDLSELNWNSIEPWAKTAWSYQGKPYGFPLEASTVELYYNKKMVDELGVAVPRACSCRPTHSPTS